MGMRLAVSSDDVFEWLGGEVDNNLSAQLARADDRPSGYPLRSFSTATPYAAASTTPAETASGAA